MEQNKYKLALYAFEQCILCVKGVKGIAKENYTRVLHYILIGKGTYSELLPNLDSAYQTCPDYVNLFKYAWNKYAGDFDKYRGANWHPVNKLDIRNDQHHGRGMNLFALAIKQEEFEIAEFILQNTSLKQHACFITGKKKKEWFPYFFKRSSSTSHSNSFETLIQKITRPQIATRLLPDFIVKAIVQLPPQNFKKYILDNKKFNGQFSGLQKQFSGLRMTVPCIIVQSFNFLQNPQNQQNQEGHKDILRNIVSFMQKVENYKSSFDKKVGELATGIKEICGKQLNLQNNNISHGGQNPFERPDEEMSDKERVTGNLERFAPETPEEARNINEEQRFDEEQKTPFSVNVEMFDESSSNVVIDDLQFFAPETPKVPQFGSSNSGGKTVGEENGDVIMKDSSDEISTQQEQELGKGNKERLSEWQRNMRMKRQESGSGIGFGGGFGM